MLPTIVTFFCLDFALCFVDDRIVTIEGYSLNSTQSSFMKIDEIYKRRLDIGQIYRKIDNDS